MSTHIMDEPEYRRDLGDGLVLRWSTKDDLAAIGDLYQYVFREKQDAPLNSYIREWATDMMSGDHPLVGPGDFAIVEDTRQQRVVASTNLMEQAWDYDGIRIPVGRPEIVASHPDYRNRGLIRAIFDIVHARSAARGNLAQGITGISYFYRQFGYEYAVDLGGGRSIPFTAIPKLKDGETESYTLRPATIDDIPQLMRLFNRERSFYGIGSFIDEGYWHWMQTGQRDASGEGFRPQMIIDVAGRAVGYALPRRLRWGERIGVSGLMVEEGVSLAGVLPGTLRALQRYGEAAAGWIAAKEPPPANSIYLHTGQWHPVYDLLGEGMVSRVWPPYAWYVRVPDLPAFIRAVAPALERRLADSAAASQTGELKLDFYRDGLRIAIEGGKITTAEPWRSAVWGPEGNAGFPPLVFLQLLFGKRSLDELRYAYNDVWAEDSARPLLEALFPTRTANIQPLD